jgi:hypothetical protein
MFAALATVDATEAQLRRIAEHSVGWLGHVSSSASEALIDDAP